MHLAEDLPLPEMVEEEDGYKHEVGCDWRGVPGTMPKAERERIALEVGARAEYWLVSRENLGSAALSWLCYVVGGLLLGVILLKQAHSVGHAGGFGLWGAFGMSFLLGFATMFALKARNWAKGKPSAKSEASKAAYV